MKLFNLFSWVQNLVEAFTFYGGSKGGGGGGGNTTQTSYSTNLPEYAKPYYEELLKQSGQQIYKTDAIWRMLQALKNLHLIQANV
jgi:hypothetical protein